MTPPSFESNSGEKKRRKKGEMKKYLRHGTFEDYPDELPSPALSDCFILHQETVGMSDHCPVVAIIKR